MVDSSPIAHSPTLSAGPLRDEDDRLGAGTPVGEYVVERFIGAGAMGEVYAGRHPVIGKRVAIKVLRLELASSAEAAERFIREARAVNQIEHENVIDVFAFGRLGDGRLYLVMDLVEGRSLRAHLVDGPLPLGTALDLLEVIAAALDAAHAKGVVHRDLKPDNIVLSNATPPKLFVLDFGIAKLVSSVGGASGPGTLTGQGTWLGTPGYMAPEQWSADGAGPASDRYALGVIAFELLAGVPPFTAASAPAMMEQHFRAKVPALASRGAVGVPTAIDAVLERALAKDPDERFSTASELVAALRAAAGSAAMRARRAPGGPKKLWVPAIAGAGVLGFAVVAVIASRGSHTAAVERTDVPPPGTVAVEIRSQPAGAQIEVDGKVQGTTPAVVALAPDVAVAVVVRKPGYLAESRTVKPDDPGVETFSLGEVTRFEGVWRIASGERAGELRKLERQGDHVSVYKLREVTGTPEFFKHYKFTAVESGVAFAADDEVVDPRKPDDPRCHVPVRVEYRYDSERDALEQRVEKVVFDQHGGDCVVRSRDIVPTPLARVDGASDTIEVTAPAGNERKDALAKKKKAGKAKVVDAAQEDAALPTKTDSLPPPDQKLNKAPAPRRTATVKPAATSGAKNSPAPASDGDRGSQIMPQSQAAPPIQTQELPQQQRQKK